MTAADVAESAHMASLVARMCDAAADEVEGLTKRVFYPEVATRYFPWPQDRFGPSRRLYLGKHQLSAVPTRVVTAVGDGDAVIGSQYVQVAPAPAGPPFDTVVLSTAANDVFQQGAVPERSVAVTGVWCGAPVAEPVETTTTTALAGTTVAVASSASVGTGTLIRIGDERLVVTARAWVDTGNIEPITLAKEKSDTLIPVTPGVIYAAGETLLLDAERLLVLSTAGDTVMVRRAVEGSALAAHSTVSALYAPRQLTVARGQLGTTAVDQGSSGVAVARFQFPGLITRLFVAEAIVNLAQSRAAYARTSGGGDQVVETVGRGLKDLREQVVRRYARLRVEAV